MPAGELGKSRRYAVPWRLPSPVRVTWTTGGGERLPTPGIPRASGRQGGTFARAVAWWTGGALFAPSSPSKPRPRYPRHDRPAESPPRGPCAPARRARDGCERRQRGRPLASGEGFLAPGGQPAAGPALPPGLRSRRAYGVADRRSIPRRSPSAQTPTGVSPACPRRTASRADDTVSRTGGRARSPARPAPAAAPALFARRQTAAPHAGGTTPRRRGFPAPGLPRPRNSPQRLSHVRLRTCAPARPTASRAGEAPFSP
ncbi:hypothetical protein HNR73_005373 [Phytomonospora endophytica]|uniref:Uncharacterized protein n=1 Tax=Phytomonospora endophytica TaxID=714109 RepID=A0A841FVZ4_9ACTN|nr:hypothetical protein [Phytomonospora endophytica]